MGKSITATAKPSRAAYEILEDLVRAKVKEFIQDILEEEVTPGNTSSVFLMQRLFRNASGSGMYSLPVIKKIIRKR